MNLNSREGLVQRLSRDRETRAQFVSSQLDKFIAFQIRALRDREQMSQTDLARELGSTQNSVSRLEAPYKSRPNITTLKRIAAVFDVGLEVRFVPFGKLVNFVSGTPYMENGLSTDSFYVPSFEQESSLSEVVESEFVAVSASMNPTTNMFAAESGSATGSEIRGANSFVPGLGGMASYQTNIGGSR